MLISVQNANLINRFGPVECYRLIRECGFEAIDWNIDMEWKKDEVLAGELGGSIFEKSHEEVMAYFADEIAEIRKNGLVISQAHAPFPTHVKGVPGFREHMIGVLKSCIRLCGAVGCKHLIVHGISCRYDEPEMTAERMWEANIELYSALIPVLKETGVMVCLENLLVGPVPITWGLCSDPNEAVAMIDTLNEMAGEECFGFCLDTGHMNLVHQNVTNYIRILGKRIKALHMHDNDAVRDQHIMPMVGTFRWSEFIAALREVGYKGDLSFETFVQVRKVEDDYCPIFLRAIAEIGKVFRQKLQ